MEEKWGTWRRNINFRTEVERAAVKMQSLHRGKMARKRAKEKAAQTRSRVRLEEAKQYAEETDAATKLQSRYRGFAARKKMKENAHRGQESMTETKNKDRVPDRIMEAEKVDNELEHSNIDAGDSSTVQETGGQEEKAEASNVVPIPNNREEDDDDDWDQQMEDLEDQEEVHGTNANEPLDTTNEGTIGKKSELQ